MCLAVHRSSHAVERHVSHANCAFLFLFDVSRPMPSVDSLLRFKTGDKVLARVSSAYICREITGISIECDCGDHVYEIMFYLDVSSGRRTAKGEVETIPSGAEPASRHSHVWYVNMDVTRTIFRC